MTTIVDQRNNLLYYNFMFLHRILGEQRRTN